MNAGAADGEVSPIPGPTAGFNRDLQRQVLRILQSPADDIQGCAGLLPEARRHPRGREQSRPTRVHLVGTVETTQVTSRGNWVFFFFII